MFTQVLGYGSNHQAGLSQEAVEKARIEYNRGLQNTPLQGAPPQPTRFSSCAGRLEAQVNHLFSCIERVSRVADRLGGSIPQEANGLSNKATGSNVAALIEEQTERFDTALKTFMHTLERLEQL